LSKRKSLDFDVNILNSTIKYTMFSRITFYTAVVLTLFVVVNISSWVYVQQAYQFQYSFSEINEYYFSFYPEFLRGPILTTLNFYLSALSILLLIAAIVSQKKAQIISTVFSVVLQIVNILCLLLMFFWQYL
jgi:hypothetical protein